MTPLAQRLTDAAAGLTGQGPTPRLKALSVARRQLLRRTDPPVRYTFAGQTLELPFSHDLPWLRAAFPGYNDNLGRIAALVAEKHPGAPAIDIGANVGDTAAALREQLSGPLLLVEGDEGVLPTLEQNARALGDVTIVRSFLAGATDTLTGGFSSEGGTGWLSVDGGGASVPVRALADVLADHPEFERSRLVKVDTDGLDQEILLGALPTLERVGPALFFEYVPDLFAQHGDGFRIFAALADAGYDRLAIFDNLGRYLAPARAGEEDGLLEALHTYLVGRGVDQY